MVFILVSSSLTFAEEELIDITLEGGLAASDEFDGSLSTERWKTHGRKWKVNYGYAEPKNLNKDTYIYQNIDYNSNPSTLSDKYEFMFVIDHENIYGPNPYSGIGVSTGPLNDNSTTNDKIWINQIKEEYIWDSWNIIAVKRTFEYRIGNLSSSFHIQEAPDTLNIYTYRITLERVNATNFIPTVEVIRPNGEIISFDKSKYVDGSSTSKQNSVTLSSMYPNMFIDSRDDAKFLSFSAKHKASVENRVVVSDLFHVGEVGYINFKDEQNVFNDFEVRFSADEQITEEDELVVTTKVTYDGKELFVFPLTTSMVSGGYFGVIGSNDSETSVSIAAEFIYLNEPDNFQYITTSDKGIYKFVWDAVDNAQLYYLNYNGNLQPVVVKDPLKENFSVTWYGQYIAAPSEVKLFAQRESGVSRSDSTSNIATPNKGQLDPVENLSGAIIKKTIEEEEKYFVDLTWKKYDGAFSYKIDRDIGNSTFVELTTINKVGDNDPGISYSDPLTSQFLKLNYRIQAKVGDELTTYSDTFVVENKVKDVFYNFDDSGHEDETKGYVNLYWKPIDEAKGYSVFLSKNDEMLNDEIQTNILKDNLETSGDYLTYRFEFDKNDKDNRYVQVQAYSDDIKSGKTDVMEIDYSRNRMVKDLQYTYTPNSRQILLSWSKLEEASNYGVWVGADPKKLKLVDTTIATDYAYRLKIDDPNTQYIAIQGLTSESSFVLSHPLVVDTFEKDYVENLIPIRGDDNSLYLRWNNLFRADGYKLYKQDVEVDLDVDDNIIRTNAILVDNVLLGDEFYVRGVIEDGENEYLSKPSNQIVVADSNSDINITTVDSIEKKIYGSPLEFEIDFKVERDINRLYDVQVEIGLDNLIDTTDTLLATYVYPEIVGVSIIDNFGNSTDITYDMSIETGRVVNGVLNGEGGYKIIVKPHEVESVYLSEDYTLRIKLKTDYRFSDKLMSEISYARMELPFYITKQIEMFEETYGSGFLNSGTHIDAILSYKLTTDSTDAEVVSKSLEFAFENKTIILGE